MNRIEDFPCQQGKRGALEFAIVHIARDDLVVLSHALNHQLFHHLAYPQLKLVQWIGQRGLNHLCVGCGTRLDLLEEKSALP